MASLTLAVETQSSDPISHPLIDRPAAVVSSATDADGIKTDDRTAPHADERNELLVNSLSAEEYCSCSGGATVTLLRRSATADDGENADTDAKHNGVTIKLNFMLIPAL